MATCSASCSAPIRTTLRRVSPSAVTWLRELRPHVTYREYFDLHGFTTTRLVHIDNHFVFANGAFFQLPAFNYTREGRLHRPERARLTAQLHRRRRLLLRPARGHIIDAERALR